jgi:glycosyltransferase involved in cell wall biosynthesis
VLLSVIIPVYNEAHTVEELIERVRSVAVEKEIIVVDDCSTDGTRAVLKKYEDQAGIKIVYHEKNKGKGAALRTGLGHVSGDLVIFQDADLEYHPEEYPRLMEPILRGRADVVYGSRFLGAHRAFLFWHYLGNKLLTLLTNLLYNSCLTDMETCYKMFRRDVIESIKIKSDRFNVEPEITAKVLKRRFRVFEVPITYSGRDFTEGKKITWKDGFSALLTLIKYRFRD